MKKIHLLAVGVALLFGVGCESAEEGTITSAPKTEVVTAQAPFCDQVEKLDALQRPPKDSELDRLQETAPLELEEEVEILIAAAREHREGGGEDLPSPEVQDAGKRLDAYVDKNCPARKTN